MEKCVICVMCVIGIDVLDRPRARAWKARHADRQRRYRARQRNGALAITVEIDANILDLLMRTRWLDPTTTDRQAITRALAAMLHDAAKR